MSKVSTDAVTQLRRWISEGRLQPGARLTEVQVAEDLGVSRTPIRLAFRTLEQEGLLQKAGRQGYIVREFTWEDVRSGLEVRGVLEGLAARRLAENGVDEVCQKTLEACLTDGRALFSEPEPQKLDIDRWSRINRRFHSAIVDAAGSQVIADAIARNDHLPFASADSIILNRNALGPEFLKLQLAQWQHELMVQALLEGEGARAEALMREHANVGFRYGHLFGLSSEIRAPYS